MNERFTILESEREKVLKNYFKQGVDGPLDIFPSKDKRKFIIAQELIKRFQVGKEYQEVEINRILKEVYPDFATIRRYFIDYEFMKRSDDGKVYWIESE
ncbi:DUF2087 domain-containing protein [Sporosarcina saromensis]|uniref:DUF2087 domain-containing protein n=1 Tax=Sporosarcina saromensis TaxID=359365 RepID=A0ABU4G4V7_9BACL|nr:DUF2087 domain-containing protein [Sporosarcina saromensis]MDW0112005.1 DUF2087 domain-containing protein [Sporosarcina saromensis]